MFDQKELELILEGLSLLEDDIQPTMPDLSGLVSADSAEEAQRIIEGQVREAKASLKDSKRRVILLKAKVVQAQIESELAVPSWMKGLRGGADFGGNKS